MTRTFFIHLAGLFVFAGCSTATDTTSSADLTIDEAVLASAQDSLAVSDGSIRACFDTFKTCADAATTDDGRKACGDTLKSCLPADMPAPRKCGGPGDEAAGQPPQPPQPPQNANPSGSSDGGLHVGPRGRDGKACPPPPGDVGQCRHAAAPAATDSAATSAAASTTKQCVHDAVKKDCKDRCARDLERCANDTSAPADVCARIKTACAAIDTSSGDTSTTN